MSQVGEQNQDAAKKPCAQCDGSGRETEITFSGTWKQDCEACDGTGDRDVALKKARRLLLTPYVSNADEDIFALTGLPEEVIAVLFAYYSRSNGDLRTNLAKLLIDGDLNVARPATGPAFAMANKAAAFHEKWVVGYGHGSVAEHAVVHLAIENVSILASKAIEDLRLGSFTEKSTRYVVFGRDSFVDLPELPEAERTLYRENGERLFTTYLAMMPQVIAALTARNPPGTAATAIRSQACDLLRGLLPAGTRTNIGLTANARALEGLLSKMMSSPLAEVRRIAADMHRAALTIAPTLVKYAAPNAYRAGRIAAVTAAITPPTGVPHLGRNAVTLLRHDEDAPERVAMALAFEALDTPVDTPHSGWWPGDDERPTRANALRLIAAALENRGRHDAVPRAFEATSFTVELLLDYGAYRDLQRHRLLTPTTQRLTAALDFEVPPDLVEMGLGWGYENAMHSALATWEMLAESHPHEAQYAVPLGYRIRTLWTLNLRELFHVVELRSGKQGHESYRRIAQALYKAAVDVHPWLADMIRVDLNDYALARA